MTDEIPKKTVTEAIVKAVAHRNYTGNGAVQVMLFVNWKDFGDGARLG